MIVILSCSLNSDSYSWILAKHAERVLNEEGVETTFLDLRQLPLPPCDGEKAYGDRNVGELKAKIAGAKGIIVASPIYNYDLNSAAKNAVELTGAAWENKVVGFLCTAGGASSYMSVMSFSNSLMLDFRSVIVPRFVYATGAAFAGGAISDPKIADRTAEMARYTARLAEAVAALHSAPKA